MTRFDWCNIADLNCNKKSIVETWQAGAIAEEVLASIRTVVAFGGQKKEVVSNFTMLFPH